MTHTKTPWLVTRAGYGEDFCFKHQIGTNEKTVCYTFDPSGDGTEEQHANAAFILRAVNSHDKLVRALEIFVDCWKGGDGGASSVEELAWAFEQAETALREAKGE